LGKKLKSLQREIDEEHVRREEMQAEQQKLHAHIKALEREIASCKREVEERDETIQDKEKRIYDLKKKNQELEKFKYVLYYKIKELKKQIEPREEEIRRMQSQVRRSRGACFQAHAVVGMRAAQTGVRCVQIQEMDAELARYHETNKALELQLAELRAKQKAADTEYQGQRVRVAFLDNALVRMRADIQEAVGQVQDPAALSRSVRALHRKHCVEVTSCLAVQPCCSFCLALCSSFGGGGSFLL
jgi:chromosome segregation ATPase